jgi:diadenosine tetraphosphatase ApaH/serine/threonine PP2A family protein phosphatase
VIADLEREQPGVVLHGGDLALTGPRPAEVVDRVRELGWPGVVGNTDELLWRPEEHEVQLAKAPKLAPLLRLLFEDYAPATRDLLGEERIEWLRALPAELRFEDLFLVHASPGDLWRAPMPDAPDAELAETYGGRDAALAVYCHIHRPFVRELPDLLVANSGSAGMAFDGDPRASYLLVADGAAEVRRVEYDVEREAADLERVGYPDAKRLSEMRRLGKFIAPAA